MERAPRHSGPPDPVERIRDCQSPGVDGLHGVEGRAGVIIGGNAIEVSLDQGAASEFAGSKPGARVSNGGLHHLELLCGSGLDEEKADQESGPAGQDHSEVLRSGCRLGDWFKMPLQ